MSIINELEALNNKVAKSTADYMEKLSPEEVDAVLDAAETSSIEKICDILQRSEPPYPFKSWALREWIKEEKKRRATLEAA